MQKVVLKVELYDDKMKAKAMKAVSGLSGVESVSVDMKDRKLTVTGNTDPVNVVGKLRKLCSTEILSVGPAKEEKKKEEPKKEEPKKDKPDEKKKDPNEAYLAELRKAQEAYYHHHQMMMMRQPPYPYYYAHAISVEEDPNGCVIC